MGFGGPGCWAGADAGRSESGLRARPDRIGFVFLIFFPKSIFNAQTIPEKSSNCFKAPKILGKFQKFQEKSQRHFGTRAIQIKFWELMKRILEPSNK
jgi:hypothetical protein